MKISDIPDVDLKKFEEFKKRNFKARLEFIKQYADWIKKTPNKIWSAQQKEIIG